MTSKRVQDHSLRGDKNWPDLESKFKPLVESFLVLIQNYYNKDSTEPQMLLLSVLENFSFWYQELQES